MAVVARKQEDAEVLLGAYPAPTGEAAWASDARARAETTLRREGAPARRDEYFKFTDPAALAATLNRLLDQADERIRLGRNGREKARRLSWRHIASRLDALYREVLGMPDAAPARVNLSEALAPKMAPRNGGAAKDERLPVSSARPGA